jgi:hypothetical protein
VSTGRRLTPKEIREDEENTKFWLDLVEAASSSAQRAAPVGSFEQAELTPAFGNLLILALRYGRIKELADYIATTSLTMGDQRYLAWFIRSLQKPRRGRPKGKKSPRYVAAGNAFHWVLFERAKWCREHGRERAPADVTREFIRQVIPIVRKQFGVALTVTELWKKIEKNDRAMSGPSDI